MVWSEFLWPECPDPSGTGTGVAQARTELPLSVKNKEERALQGFGHSFCLRILSQCSPSPGCVHFSVPRVFLSCLALLLMTWTMPVVKVI